MVRFRSVLLLGMCPCVASVCEVVVVAYVDAVIAVTLMRVLLSVLCVCMLREYEGDGNVGVGDGGGVVVVSAGHVGGTHGSGTVSSAADVIGMSVLRGMKGVGGVCEICMCLARGGVGGEGGEWMKGMGLGFTNPVGTGGVLDVCLCWGCGGLGGEWVEGLEVWGGVMSV